MKRILQTFSGIATGVFLAWSIFFICRITSGQLLFWADASVHPAWISALSGIIAFFAGMLCLHMRENLLGLTATEAWVQRLIIGLFVLIVLGILCFGHLPFP